MQNIGRTPIKILSALSVVFISTGCDHGGISTVAPASIQATPNIANLVIGAAAAALGANGQLTLATPTPLSSTKSEIPEFRARELAKAFLVTHGRGFRRVLETDHGGPVDLDALRVCGRVWYANSVFTPLAPEVPDPWQRVYGPWWLVTFCGPAELPEVSVAVSAYATDVTIENGRLMYPAIFGGEFQVLGIPLSLSSGFPPSPERAVELAARVSGVKVIEVPELIAAPPGVFPQSARWRVRLERPVNIPVGDVNRSVRRVNGVTELFVSTTYFAKPEVVQIADPDQPASVPLTYREVPPIGSTRAQVQAVPVHSTILVRRPQFPIRYLTIQGN